MLSKEQLKLLNDELNISYEQIENATEDEWKEIRAKCFIIESDETELDESGAGYLTPLGTIAAQITEMSYKKMKATA